MTETSLAILAMCVLVTAGSRGLARGSAPPT
jgi:hypothetical protein